MLDRLGEDVKKVLLAGIGAAALTAEKSKDVIDELVKKGELTVEQGKIINEELKHDIKEKLIKKRCGANRKDDGGFVCGGIGCIKGKA